MRHCLLAASLATVACVLTAWGGEPADPAVPETEPARTTWSLVDGIPMPTMGGMQFWGDELFFHDGRCGTDGFETVGRYFADNSRRQCRAGKRNPLRDFRR